MNDEDPNKTAFLFMLAWSFGANWLAWKGGYYTLPTGDLVVKPRVLFRDVFGIFALFLLIMLVLVPGSALVFHYSQSGVWELPPSFERGWMNIVAIFASALGVIFFCRVIEPQTKGIVSFQGWNKFKQDISWGALSWLICFPLVSLLAAAVSITLEYFQLSGEADQVAVRYLKEILSERGLFWASFTLIIFIVPFVEETLFRGFLQTWLRRHLNRVPAIALSSAIFAGFHFSVSQGWQNINLLTALFLLACFLGFLYEKRGSIWAPAGLHMTFNAISEIAIVAQEGGF